MLRSGKVRIVVVLVVLVLLAVVGKKSRGKERVRRLKQGTLTHRAASEGYTPEKSKMEGLELQDKGRGHHATREDLFVVKMR